VVYRESRSAISIYFLEDGADGTDLYLRHEKTGCSPGAAIRFSEWTGVVHIRIYSQRGG